MKLSYVSREKMYTSEVLEAITKEKTDMTQKEFIDHCTTCGGNWTALLMTGLKDLFPLTFAALPDTDYGFEDICDLIAELGVYE